MTIQQAIEKAIEGGYNPSFTGDLFWYIGYDSGKYRVFLDPLFWQSLGKAMGWRSEAGSYYDGIAWQEYWHRFIDHLAEGKDAESFFEGLDKK